MTGLVAGALAAGTKAAAPLAFGVSLLLLVGVLALLGSGRRPPDAD